MNKMNDGIAAYLNPEDALALENQLREAREARNALAMREAERVTFAEGEHVKVKGVLFTVSRITSEIMVLRPVGQSARVSKKHNGKRKR